MTLYRRFLFLLLLLCTPVTSTYGQDRDAERLDSWLRDTATRYAESDVDLRALLVRDVWRVHAEDPSLGIVAGRQRLVTGASGPARLFYDCLPNSADAADPFERNGGPDAPLSERLEAMLDAGRAEQALLDSTVEYFRFLSLADALHRDAPEGWLQLRERHAEHPWIAAQLRLWSREDDLQDAVALLAPLSAPGVGHSERVLVWDGGWGFAGNRYSFSTQVGWLLSTTSERFEILANDLERHEFVPDSLQTQDDEGRPSLAEELLRQKDGPIPRYEVIDFEDEMVSWIAGGPRNDYGRLAHFSGGGLPFAIEALLRASWADQRGRRGMALRLFELAEAMLQADKERRGEPNAPGTLAEFVASALALSLWHRGVVALGDGAPRSDVILMLERVSQSFPDTECGERSRVLLDG
ncbi:hypothetical protein OAX78_03320, partial [Planctomycetota bacterium]|nr:hypothetical protein [Planctomycetota bacterium]